MQAAAIWIGLIVMEIAWEASILIGKAKLHHACKPEEKIRLKITTSRPCSLRGLALLPCPSKRLNDCTGD